MNELKNNSESKEQELEEQLKKLPKEKWKIWRLIAVGIFLPFVGPYIPLRKGMLADRMGYKESALLFGLILLFAVPIGCYMHFQKINDEISDVECELEILKRKKQQEINNENSK